MMPAPRLTHGLEPTPPLPRRSLDSAARVQLAAALERIGQLERALEAELRRSAGLRAALASHELRRWSERGLAFACGMIFLPLIAPVLLWLVLAP